MQNEVHKIRGRLVALVVLGGWMLIAQPTSSAFSQDGTIQPVVAILDIQFDEVSIAGAASERMNQYLASRIAGEGTYLVVPRDQVASALVAQKAKAQEPCYGSCQIKLGNAVAANKVLQCKMMRVGDDCSVILDLYDIQTETLERSVEVPKVKCDEGGLREGISKGAQQISIQAPANSDEKVQMGRGTVVQGVQIGQAESVVNTPSEETGFLFIETEPPAAIVYINGVPYGAAPFQEVLPVGRYVVSATLNTFYHDARQEVILTAKGARVRLTLPPAFGTLAVNSTPSDAEIFVDDVPVGRTPYMNTQVKSGEHRVEVRKEFYKSSQFMVSVRDGEKTSEMAQLSQDFGGITIDTVPSGASIRIDDIDVGQLSPVEIERVRSGLHLLSVFLEGHGQYVDTVRILNGETKKLNVVLEPKLGTLVVMSQKPDGTPCEGDVKIDGTSVGMTPWKGQLIAKDHTIDVNCDGAVGTESVEVQHNSQSILRVKVKPFDYEGLVYLFREDYVSWGDESKKGLGIFRPLTLDEVGGEGVDPWEQIDRLKPEYSKPKNRYFTNGKRFSVITTSGVVESTITSQEIWPGAGWIFHKVIIDWPLKNRETLGLAVYDQEIPGDLCLQAPPKFIDSDAARIAFTNTKTYLKKRASKDFPEESRLINQLQFKPEHFSYVKARFPGHFEALAIVHVPNDEPSDYSSYSRYLFVDDKGDVIPGHEHGGRVEQIFFVDLNQDGLDEVFLLTSGYESDAAELLIWDGGIPKVIDLWSDGF